MPALKDRLTDTLTRIRERYPFLDHVFRMFKHYGTVKGTVQAGAVTFFAFLSFFPILALGFWAAGIVSVAFPDAEGATVDAIKAVLPGLVGDGPGELSLQTVQENASTAGIIGLAGVVFAGLGWLSGMRQALLIAFEKPSAEQPNFVVGKAKDLVSLAIIGLVLVLSVSVTGAVSGFSEQLLDLVGLGLAAEPLVKVLGSVLGLLANMALFFALFRILADPDLPPRSLWEGALLGALGFEALKLASSYLIAYVQGKPAFAAFGIALILLVWINYFSRVVMYAAAWAYTGPRAVARREAQGAAQPSEAVPEGPAVGPAVSVGASVAVPSRGRPVVATSATLALGGALGAAAAHLLARRRDDQ